MVDKVFVALGVWLVSDSLFSLATYWGKEAWWCQAIRITRLAVGFIVCLSGFLWRALPIVGVRL